MEGNMPSVVADKLMRVMPRPGIGLRDLLPEGAAIPMGHRDP